MVSSLLVGGGKTLRVQARIGLSADLRALIEPYRQRWNPERAAGNPAHVTIIYHDEAPSLALLRERLTGVASRLPTFELHVGAPRRFTPPVLGVFLSVADPSGSVSRLRAQVLAGPFRARTRFGLHVTIIHPEQGHRADEAWPELCGITSAGSMQVTELILVNESNESVARIPLAAP